MLVVNETVAHIALTRIPRINLVTVKTMVEQVGSAIAILQARSDIRQLLPDATDKLAEHLRSANMDEALSRAEAEYEYAQKNNIRCLALLDEAYPQALLQCPDAPLVLYSIGQADLNNPYIINIVGTRRATDYGRYLTQQLVSQLAAVHPDLLIVSGLAYGIDINAHRAALENNMPTVGVLAHGLDMIYPQMHRATAAQMIRQRGGLLTEYVSQTPVEKQNFVRRNRIVAGLAAATVVVESAAKGGALITADLAGEYNREVFAFPGRVGDRNSEGTNRLIAQHRAHLITCADDLLEVLGWNDVLAKPRAVQTELFPEAVALSPVEQAIYNVLSATDPMPVNQITIAANLPLQQVSATLFELEMKNLVVALGGARYRRR